MTGLTPGSGEPYLRRMDGNDLRRPRGGRLDAFADDGFTLTELLIVVMILLILSAIAINQLLGTRTKKVVREAVDSLPAIKAWEERQFELNGGYVLSDVGNPEEDVIGFASVSWDTCANRFIGGNLENAAVNVTPQGCQWEYFVVGAFCVDGCTTAGTGNCNLPDGTPLAACFCVIAQPSPAALPSVQGERLCIDSVGNQFTTLTSRVPAGWR